MNYPIADFPVNDFRWIHLACYVKSDLRKNMVNGSAPPGERSNKRDIQAAPVEGVEEFAQGVHVL